MGQVEPTNGKVVIGFATSAGDTADDGTGNMSPYASALANRLKEKDDIRNILGKVADDVSAKYEQNPIYKANLKSNVCLNGKCSNNQQIHYDEDEIYEFISNFWKDFKYSSCEKTIKYFKYPFLFETNNWILKKEHKEYICKKGGGMKKMFKDADVKFRIMMILPLNIQSAKEMEDMIISKGYDRSNTLLVLVERRYIKNNMSKKRVMKFLITKENSQYYIIHF